MDILLLESRQTSGSELLVTSSLVGAATLGGELTSHTGGRKSSCGVRRVLEDILLLGSRQTIGSELLVTSSWWRQLILVEGC